MLVSDLRGLIEEPHGGWPAWVANAPYDGARGPEAGINGDPSLGANCQLFSYSILGLFGRPIGPLWSSELWEATTFQHVPLEQRANLDLVLFNASDDATAAHVGVAVGSKVLHLSGSVGKPAIWSLDQFSRVPSYACTVGVVRVASATD